MITRSYRGIVSLFVGLSLVVSFDSSSRAANLRPASGKDCGFWTSYSLILAQVVQYRRPANAPDNLITLRPLGTLCGKFDASRNAVLETTIGGWGVDSALPQPPAPGRYVLAVLSPGLKGTTTEYVISNEGMTFMPTQSSLVILNDLSDPRIAEALANARKVRYAADLAVVEHPQPEDTSYWGTHFLLYGEIKYAERRPLDQSTMGVLFLPTMTLSGDFDAGASHRVFLTGDPKLLDHAPKGNALLLGVKEKDGFAIPDEQPAFMPGDHSPICPITDLSDPKFGETLKAVQTAREKESAQLPMSPKKSD